MINSFSYFNKFISARNNVEKMVNKFINKTGNNKSIKTIYLANKQKAI